MNKVISKCMAGKKNIIFWWPKSIFFDVDWKKDPGSIPLELQNIGYDVTLIVGAFNASKIHKIKTITTNRIKGSIKFNFINRALGMLVVLKTIIKKSPNAIIIEHGEIETLLLSFLLKTVRPSSRPLLILKLDADPEFLSRGNKNFIVMFYIYI